MTTAGGPGFRALFAARVELAGTLRLGRTPLGERRMINILSGSFHGERLKGNVPPGGADWRIILAAGAADLDARPASSDRDQRAPAAGG